MEDNKILDQKNEKNEMKTEEKETLESENSNDKTAENKELSEKDKKKNIWKYFIYLLVVLIITGIVIYINLFQDVEGDEGTKVYEMIPYFIQNMNYSFLALFLFIVLFSYLLNSFMMFLYARLYQRHYKYHQAMAAQSWDIFYSSITPGAYGGEIAKVYIFNKQGVGLSNAASLLVMNFIVYQTCLIFIGFVSLCVNFNQILSIPAFPISITIDGKPIPDIPFYVFIILGFLLNLLTMGFILLMSSSRTIHNFVLNHLINFLGKIKLVKNVEEKKEIVRLQIENYRIELRRLRSNIPFTLLVFFLTLFSIIIGNLYPLLSGLTLNGFQGLNDVNYFQKIVDCVSFANFHQMVTGLIPIPGTAGISEYVFDRLFGANSSYFSQSFYNLGGANLVLLLWRLITFYLQFLVCGIVTATYKTRGAPLEDRIVPVSNRKTALTLTIETIEDRREELEESLKEKQNKKEVEKRKQKEERTNK